MYELHIEFMVSLRCKMVVKSALDGLGIKYGCIDLGKVDILEEISNSQLESLGKELHINGLNILDTRKSILIERIKNVVIEMVHYSDDLPLMNYSEYISQKLDYDYNYLSNIFSEVKGITIQQFILLHKVEKIKELILYDELNLTEISYKLHYSSLAHLSNQFKKVTGLSPFFFKKMKYKRVRNLENIGEPI
jgi:AraC-like DNA-binding protein